MQNFNEMSITDQVDYLSDCLGDAIFEVDAKAYQSMLQGQQAQAKLNFFDTLKANNMIITDIIIEAVEQEFPCSPMASMLREYGFTVTKQTKFTPAVEQLTTGRKVTIIKFSEFGFPVATNTTIDHAEVTQYAQHKDALKLTHKPKRKKSILTNWIMPYAELLVYDGWLDVDIDAMTKNTLKETDSVKVTQGKYKSFDKNYIADIVNAITHKPLVYVH